MQIKGAGCTVSVQVSKAAQNIYKISFSYRQYINYVKTNNFYSHLQILCKGVHTTGLDQKFAKDPNWMLTKGAVCTVSVQVSWAAQNFYEISYSYIQYIYYVKTDNFHSDVQIISKGVHTSGLD